MLRDPVRACGVTSSRGCSLCVWCICQISAISCLSEYVSKWLCARLACVVCGASGCRACSAALALALGSGLWGFGVPGCPCARAPGGCGSQNPDIRSAIILYAILISCQRSDLRTSASGIRQASQPACRCRLVPCTCARPVHVPPIPYRPCAHSTAPPPSPPPLPLPHGQWQ